MAMIKGEGTTFNIQQLAQLQSPYRLYNSYDLPTADYVLSKAIGKEIPIDRSNLPISDEVMDWFVRDCIEEIHSIEIAARNPRKWEFNEIDANRTKLIVDFSAAGSYKQLSKNDRYNGKSFATGMDRVRADTSAKVGIQIAGVNTGHNFWNFTEGRLLTGLDPTQNGKRELVRQAIRDSELEFLYLGRPDEGEAIKKVIETPSSFIPPESVTVIANESIGTTYDQVLALKSVLHGAVNSGEYTKGDRVLFPLGPQTIRVMRYCSKLEAIPSELEVAIFPIETPKVGFPDYPTNEIKGILAHILEGKALRTAHPYVLLGNK